VRGESERAQSLGVAVVVDREPDRRAKLSLAMRMSGALTFEIFLDPSDGRVVAEDSGTPVDIPRTDALLVLRHFRDRAVLPDLRGCVTIWYGGSGGDDPDCPHDAAERIWRPVAAGSGCLTAQEAAALTQYVRTKYAEGGTCDRPSFLKPDDSASVVAALHVLCEGYLLATESQRLDTQRPRADARAEPTGTDASVSPALAALPAEGPVRSWWLETFGLSGSPRGVAARALGDRLRQEWSGNLPEEIEALLRAIDRDEIHLLAFHALVANACHLLGAQLDEPEWT
jgi:hypothetical protein